MRPERREEDKRRANSERAISRDLGKAAVVSHQMGRLAIERTEHESDVVRIARITAQMEERDHHPFAGTENRADELPHDRIANTGLDQFFDVFEEHIIRLEQDELARFPSLDDFTVRTRGRLAPLRCHHDVRVQHGADSRHYRCSATLS